MKVKKIRVEENYIKAHIEIKINMMGSNFPVAFDAELNLDSGNVVLSGGLRDVINGDTAINRYEDLVKSHLGYIHSRITNLLEDISSELDQDTSATSSNNIVVKRARDNKYYKVIQEETGSDKTSEKSSRSVISKPMSSEEKRKLRSKRYWERVKEETLTQLEKLDTSKPYVYLCLTHGALTPGMAQVIRDKFGEEIQIVPVAGYKLANPVHRRVTLADTDNLKHILLRVRDNRTNFLKAAAVQNTKFDVSAIFYNTNKQVELLPVREAGKLVFATSSKI